LLAAKSIAISSGSSGNYLVGLFERMGIADEIKPKVKQIAPGLAVGDVIARGDAEIGFQQVSELLPIAGITYVGPLPPELQISTVYAGGIRAGANAPDAAAELLKYLKSPAAFPAIKRAGMEPPDAR
jgi:molybdate transport system substrate-binding protein